jgi:hypothetical protein
MKIEDIKNHTFKKNIIDTEENKIVSSIYLNSNKRIDNSEFYTKNCKHLIWKYYKDRNKINVNDVIKQYGRDILIINYSIETHKIIINDINCN